MNTARAPEVEPGIVTLEDGQVILDGPDGVAVSMTPDCAEETGRRLIAAAREVKALTASGRDGR